MGRRQEHVAHAARRENKLFNYIDLGHTTCKLSDERQTENTNLTDKQTTPFGTKHPVTQSHGTGPKELCVLWLSKTEGLGRCRQEWQESRHEAYVKQAYP